MTINEDKINHTALNKLFTQMEINTETDLSI